MADYNTEQFEKDCKALGVTLSDEQIQQFLKYYEMLVEWNEVMNLTAITEYDEVMKKHFVDSISLCKAYDVTQNKTVIDVGTGAGFPGLALKIAFPDLQVTLLDSLNKRINFLNEVIAALGLTGAVDQIGLSPSGIKIRKHFRNDGLLFLTQRITHCLYGLHFDRIAIAFGTDQFCRAAFYNTVYRGCTNPQFSGDPLIGNRLLF